MSLSYDGSLLYHLAAQMPLHCIILVALPSCPFVALACRRLLRLLASLLHVSLLADCCVHPPLLPPPVAINKKTHSTPTLMSASCNDWHQDIGATKVGTMPLC
jgi:hypothetical protein